MAREVIRLAPMDDDARAGRVATERAKRERNRVRRAAGRALNILADTLEGADLVRANVRRSERG